MSFINMKIKGKKVLGDIVIDGKIYYVDEERTIYKEVNDEYIEEKNKKTIEKIYSYIFPKSIDFII